MAITFENVIYDRVIDALQGLLVNDFQSRDYVVEIEYQLKAGGAYTKNSIKQVSNIAERVKRLIFDNATYSPSNAYKWHDGNIDSIEYSRDEDSPDLITAVMEFNCTSTEVT